MSTLCRWSLLCSVNLYVSPSNLNNFILRELHRSPFWWILIFVPICWSFLKLLVQEVEYTQFLLHKAVSTKNSLIHLYQENIEVNGIFKKKIGSKLRKMPRNCQNKFIQFSSLCHIMWWFQCLHKFWAYCTYSVLLLTFIGYVNKWQNIKIYSLESDKVWQNSAC